jgi:hypothetical protein
MSLIVEHSYDEQMPLNQYLPLAWAADIEVRVTSERLFIRGTELVSDRLVQRSRDSFFRYTQSTKAQTGQERTGMSSPHTQFANASTDEKLIEFVREFGPVVAASVSEVYSGTMPTLKAEQSMDTLRRERQLYAALLTLLAEVDEGKAKASIERIRSCISEIVEGVWYWADQFKREQRWRTAQDQLSPWWHFDQKTWEWIVSLNVSAKLNDPPFAGPDAFRSGHLVLCSLINAFRTEVQVFGDQRLEAPVSDSLLFGVRPVLYHILKYEYLRRNAIRICGNVRCNQLFAVERAGQQFCSSLCSRKQRQRDYFRERGSGLRKKRARKKRRPS